MFGMQMKLVIPRSQITNLRRCIQAVSRISSEKNNSALPSFSVNQSRISSLSTQPTRMEELNRYSVPALKDLCRSYGVRVGGICN